MKWTFNLMRVRGIEIKIHLTFLLILALGGYEWGRVHGASGFAFGVLIMLALIAVFIFFGAGMESFQAKAKTVLTTRRIGDAYNKHALTLNPNDRVSTVVDYILTSYQPDFAVVLGNRLLGVVTRDDVLKTLAARSDDPYVAEIMQREVPQVEASAGIDEVQERMGSEQARLVAVYAGERFLGLVSREDLGEALSVLLFTARKENVQGSLGQA